MICYQQRFPANELHRVRVTLVFPRHKSMLLGSKASIMDESNILSWQGRSDRLI